jgi:quercetin dioxygenase-like cupin family protein
VSTPTGPGIVLQPEDGQAYWQPRWANGYSIVKLSPKHAGPDNLAMGVQVIAPGGYVREHSHTPNQEILFCFAGKGTILVDGVPHPFVPGTTVYAGPGVRHKIVNDGPDELKMTWTYLPLAWTTSLPPSAVLATRASQPPSPSNAPPTSTRSRRGRATARRSRADLRPRPALEKRCFRFWRLVPWRPPACQSLSCSFWAFWLPGSIASAPCSP